MDKSEIEIIRMLISHFSDTVLVLSSKLEEHKDDSIIVVQLLRRLEKYASEVQDSNSPVANLLLDCVYAHRTNLAFMKDEYEEVVRLARQGMSVASADDPSYYCFVGSTARAHIELGDDLHAYKVIGEGINTAMKEGVDEVEVPGLLHTAMLADLKQASVEATFMGALKEFAQRNSDINEREFTSLWNRDPMSTLERIIRGRAG